MIKMKRNWKIIYMNPYISKNNICFLNAINHPEVIKNRSETFNRLGIIYNI